MSVLTPGGDLFSQEVMQVMAALGRSGAFQQLTSLIKEVVTSSLAQLQGLSQPPKEHLKLILASLIDEVSTTLPHQSPFGPRTTARQPPKREVKSASRSVRSSQTALKSSPSHSEIQRKPPTAKSPSPMNSLQARSFEEMYSLVTDM